MATRPGTAPTTGASHCAPAVLPRMSSHLRSPYYNASHRAFRERVRAFVDAEVTPFCDQWDRRVRARRSETQLTDGELCRAKAIPRELFAKAFAAGLLPGVVGPPWPVAYAGPGPEARRADNGMGLFGRSDTALACAGLRRLPRAHPHRRGLPLRLRRCRVGPGGGASDRTATRAALWQRCAQGARGAGVPARPQGDLPLHFRAVRWQRRGRTAHDCSVGRVRTALRGQRRKEVDHQRHVRRLFHRGCAHGRRG